MAGHPTGSIALLTRLSKVIHRRSSEALLGMRLRQLMVLGFVRDQECVAQQELGEILQIDANNLVLLLNELDSLGYIERQRDPGDRRRHRVVLTEVGRRALERAERAQESIEDEVLAELNAEERATLRDLLLRALRRHTGPGHHAPPAAGETGERQPGA
jgi:DNA-binding MarR family transcriptional regulator